MTAADVDHLREWVGKTERRYDVIAPAPVAGLSASLNYQKVLAAAGEPLPACWHWLYFHDVVRTSDLAVDGHAIRGNFLPPVPLPRRMWAGGRLTFSGSLQVGDEVCRVSTIQSVGNKRGRSGELVFVTVRHQVYCGDRLVIDEEQDLVYRENAGGNAAPLPQSAPAAAQWSAEACPDPLLLFRYSALTFNSHRIHYDRDYAVREEGYDGLVVQGPLTATLLLDLLHRQLPAARIETFNFRAKRPLLAGSALRLEGRQDGPQVALWALNASGEIAMEAQASLADG